MVETWKDIPEYEGIYQVSNFGRVKSLGRKVRSGFGFRNIKTKDLKLTNSGSYLAVSLHKKGKCKVYEVQRLVAMAFLNHVPEGHNLVVDHIDNNPLNNYVENLRLITNRQNSTRVKNGTSIYTGLSFDKKYNKWRVRICLLGNKKSLYLGHFKDENEAGNQYQKALKYIIDNSLRGGEITAKELRNKIKTKTNDSN